jgi:hypothetical protein
MRAPADSPIATFVSTITVTSSKVVKVIVVNPRMSTDGGTSPALTGKGKADSPAASAMWQLILEYQFLIARATSGKLTLTDAHYLTSHFTLGVSTYTTWLVATG